MSKWVSVSEKLPRHGCEVLVTNGKRHWVARLARGSFGQDVWASEEKVVEGITHWKRLKLP